MSSSQVEKKDCDVEMGEASQAPTVLAVHEATQSFIAGFDSFKERLSRRSAAKDSTRARTEAPSVPPSPVPSSPAPRSAVPSDAPLPAGGAVVPEQIPDVQDRPSGSSTAPIIICGRDDVVECTPPASKIVLGLPAPSAAPLPKGRPRGIQPWSTDDRVIRCWTVDD
ncbi:hypothetical protein Bca4012_065336 [Brassica carinata]